MNPIEALAALLLATGSILVLRALFLADMTQEAAEPVLEATPERKAA